MIPFNLLEGGKVAYISIDGLIEKTGSTYKLAILASRRALELDAGAPKLVSNVDSAKNTTIAIEEIRQNKIALKKKKDKS